MMNMMFLDLINQGITIRCNKDYNHQELVLSFENEVLPTGDGRIYCYTKRISRCELENIPQLEDLERAITEEVFWKFSEIKLIKH